MKARNLRHPRQMRPALASLALALALPLTQAAVTLACEAGTTDPNAPAPASSDPNAPASSAAAKPSSAATPPAAAAKPEVLGAKVFTNKDLERYHSTRPPATLVVDMNAVKQAKDDEAAAAAESASEPVLYPDEKARRMAELQESIKEAEGRIAAIDKQAAFFANPYLPPPQLTPEEIQAQKGMSQKDAYLALETEKAALTEKLASLRADLATVIATPTQPRSTPAVTNPAASQPNSPP